MPGTFQIARAKDNEYFFNLLAPNGEVILTSQMYKAKNGVRNGISSVQTNASEEGRYDRRVDKQQHHYFVLKAANQKVIGRSQSYSSAAAMEKGIKSVMKNGTSTKINDTTG